MLQICKERESDCMSNKEKKVYGEPLHNAVGYIRVSTQGQADKFGEEAQRRVTQVIILPCLMLMAL